MQYFQSHTAQPGWGSHWENDTLENCTWVQSHSTDIFGLYLLLTSFLGLPCFFFTICLHHIFLLHGRFLWWEGKMGEAQNKAIFIYYCLSAVPELWASLKMTTVSVLLQLPATHENKEETVETDHKGKNFWDYTDNWFHWVCMYIYRNWYPAREFAWKVSPSTEN